jgi:hypothetical protein
MSAANLTRRSSAEFYALTVTAIPSFFHTESLLNDLLFANSSIKVSKKCRSRTKLFIQVSGKFSRVKLDSSEAQLRPVEQLNKRPPRGTSSLLSGNRMPIIMDV